VCAGTWSGWTVCELSVPDRRGVEPLSGPALKTGCLPPSQARDFGYTQAEVIRAAVVSRDSRRRSFILDELGYLPFAQTGSQLLFHLISRLYERTFHLGRGLADVELRAQTGCPVRSPVQFAVRAQSRVGAGLLKLPQATTKCRVRV
jgi:hypothetical protein